MGDRRCVFVFFFNDTATTEIYTLSLHDALPISIADLNEERGEALAGELGATFAKADVTEEEQVAAAVADRKSTRLNSSHANISYAVFCLKKKNKLDADSFLRTAYIRLVRNPTCA